MIRDWSFTLKNASQWYNLWDDLIAKDASFTDATFGNTPFVPSAVNLLTIQNQSPGATVQMSDYKKEQGFYISGGSVREMKSQANEINLKNRYFLSDTANTVISVSIASN